ncbi:MAG: FixH family protein [Planctomycetota bacterium]
MSVGTRRKAGWYWPWAIGGLLGFWAIGDITVLLVASNHPSFAVEEDYYQKALAWDQTKAEQQASDRLNWTATVAYVALPPGAGPGVEMVLTLRDASGPITGADVAVRTFHRAEPKAVLRAQLTDGGDGSYRAVLAMGRVGSWQVDIVAQRGDDRFVRSSLESYWRAP